MATRTREKAQKRAENKDKRPFAIAKNVRMTPSKMGRTLDLIRGKKYAEALALLSNTRNAACEVILKVLNSAAANAENNLNFDKETLIVAECFANPGPVMKRLNQRAKGSADIIKKRTSHVTVILDTVKV